MRWCEAPARHPGRCSAAGQPAVAACVCACACVCTYDSAGVELPEVHGGAALRALGLVPEVPLQADLAKGMLLRALRSQGGRGAWW